MQNIDTFTDTTWVTYAVLLGVVNSPYTQNIVD
jgi:uncharacterized membrane protein